jgi:hypothetical protein
MLCLDLRAFTPMMISTLPFLEDVSGLGAHRPVPSYQGALTGLLVSYFPFSVDFPEEMRNKKGVFRFPTP